MKGCLEFHYGAALGEPSAPEAVTFKNVRNLLPHLQKADSLLRSHQENGMEGAGWLLLPYESPSRILEIASHLASMSDVIQIGIGGSALGNLMLHNALLPPYWNDSAHNLSRPRFYMADNVDPEENKSIWDNVDPQNTALIVVSKSGTTAETMANFLFFWNKLKERLGAEEAAKRTVVITDPEKGVLRAFAQETGCFVLPIPKGVGGRYSVLSSVGLLSAASLGIDIESLLAGAREMSDFLAATQNIEENPAWIISALAWLHAKRGRNMLVFMPYIDRLSMLSEWFAQLWGESLGKEGRGSTPIKALGTIDQHSQLQLYTEGPDDKLFMFLNVQDVKDDFEIPQGDEKSLLPLSYLFGQSMHKLRSAEELSTASALVKAGRPVLWLQIPTLDPFYLGAVLFLLEYVTALTGLIMEINPFNQPGVEQGKRYTYGLMGREGFDEEKQEVNSFSKVLSSRIITVPFCEK